MEPQSVLAFNAPNEALSATHLPVVENFHSLQGEGIHAGRSAFFIRLGGCTVGCSWCDTKHSWPAAVHPPWSVGELAEEAAHAVAAGAAFVVITGGEPLHHQLDALCQGLRNQITANQGTTVPLHLETSGVDPLSGTFDWITLSPKRHQPPTTELLAACNELKVVVHGREDLVFAQAMGKAAMELRPATSEQSPALLLQPGHNCPEGQQLAIDFVKAHPQWRLSLQTHKLLGVR
ncbi:MAG: 7-carboxy-7-deazaguanine synthase QueE [Cyanobacteriota bacterium]|jgi:organic radical activating enzyme|nr:7-carboxy-7-deazaguanine synthase QueE [Synechococcus sp. FGCU3]MEB3105317.1 7-carboxy-7-deazaguanine synthase QueE [Cyanobacteriota bacterium]